MNGAPPLGPASPKSFHAYPRGGDYDLESGSFRRIRKPKRSLPDDLLRMLKSLGHNLRHVYHLHPLAALLASLCFGLAVLVLLSLYESRLRALGFRAAYGPGRTRGPYPLPGLRSLVMVAGHSVYTSSSCGDAEREDSWVLEPYQRHAGQAATFVEHIRDGVGIAAGDEGALLLFSGGETRSGAGPRSEAQSYWEVAEAKGWFGKRDSVRTRALTEEHARDSFENLLFSVCRFRELTGTYPQNITVVSYDFKKERFAHLHRLALGFPEGRFFYFGTPATPDSEEAAKKGEASVRAQFQEDPYGCVNPLHLKRLKRDPFHRSIPYPDGCPELRGLFSYCGPVPYPGTLPW